MFNKTKNDSFMNERSLVDTKKKKASGGRAFISIITFSLIMLSCGLVSAKLHFWYCSFQKHYFDTNGSLLFIHSSYSLATILVGAFIFGFLLFEWLFYGKHRSEPNIRVIYMTLTIAVFLIA